MIGLLSRKLLERPQIRPPNHVERRADRCLLVWRDMPHWIVVDAELHGLLMVLDGSRTLNQVLADRHVASRDHRTVRRVIEVLRKRDIVVNQKTPSPPTS